MDAPCGDICNDGDEAVWGDDSDVISPVIEKKMMEMLLRFLFGFELLFLLSFTILSTTRRLDSLRKIEFSKWF